VAGVAVPWRDQCNLGCILAVTNANKLALELFKELNTDDELCFLDYWINKHPKELRESLGQMGQYMAHIVEEDALAKQLIVVSLSPASSGTSPSPSPSECDTSGSPARPAPCSPPPLSTCESE
jgi:hypothetical protein